MAYAPLDEKFDDHPKYIEYGAAEMGLIACGITYCNRNLTDGVIPRSWPARRFGADIQVTIEVLLRDGVWVRRIDGAYEVVGFLDHNRSKAEILAIKTRKIEAGKLGGRKSAESRSGVQAPAQAPASAGGQAHGQAGAQVSAEPISTPSPRHYTPTSQTETQSQQEPPPSVVGTPHEQHDGNASPDANVAPLVLTPPEPKAPKAKRPHRLAEDWEPPPETVAKYAAQGIDCLASLARFRGHWCDMSGKHAVKLDWRRTFENWVEKDITDGVAKKKLVKSVNAVTATVRADITHMGKRYKFTDGKYVADDGSVLPEPKHG